MRVSTVSVAEANAMLRGGEHYLGGVEYPPRFCLATGECDALAVYSPPTASSFNRLLSQPLELTRLWQSPARRESGQPLSQFLGRTLWWLKKNAPECECVFSYADPHQKHKGTIYLACNFEFFGKSCVTDLWLDKSDMFGGTTISAPKMYRRHETKSRVKLQALGYELLPRPPKLLYAYGLKLTANEVRKILGGRYGNSGP